ncbi:MAG: glycosyltransferase family 4 protein [Thermodesulfovibrionales bacterium]|nr:glycosyltransferase family 4 protein [Thermodesulfovibrionales bacterium]
MDTPSSSSSAQPPRAGASVCHLSTNHSPFDTRIFYKECGSLDRAGYDVVFVVPHEREEVRDGVRIIPLERSAGRLSRMLLLPFKVLRQALGTRAQVYHFHDPELLPVGLILKVMGKRVIYDVHEDYPKAIHARYWIPGPVRGIVAAVFGAFEAFVSRRMSAVICANPINRERFQKMGIDAYCVQNFPIADEFADLMPREGGGLEERTVCYVGGIGESRGVFEMIEAAERADVKLLLAGTFYSSAERQRAMAMPGWQNVEELGYLDRQGVARTLSRSVAGLVLLRPTMAYLEAYAIKMFEYMSVGLPVIISNIPIWREIVEAHDCGVWVDPSDIDEAAEAIRRMVDNPGEARRMGENGRRAVGKNYAWEKEARVLVEVYKSIL